MLDSIIRFSLRNRLLVCLLSLVLVAFGISALSRLSVDAFPDTTPVQVQINTVAPSLNPLEIEQQITQFVELSIGGLPGLQNVRSVSKFGFSQVVATFDDSVSIYLARQLVSERLATVELPAGIDRPRLGPLRHSGFGRMLGGYLAYTARDVRRLWSRPADEPLRVTLAILEQFAAEARADGAECAGVLIFPRQGDLEHLAAGDHFWAAGLRRLEAAGVPHLDLGPQLLEAAQAGELDSLYTGGHLSPAGNRIAAEAIAAWLRDQLH